MTMPFQDYIMTAPLHAQTHLVFILQFVQNEFPDAQRRIYHGLPSFFYGKRDVINVGAHKDHIGLYVGYDIVDYFKQKYPSYRYTKAAIQFSYEAPFPFDFLKEVCSQIKKSGEAVRPPTAPP